MEIAEPSHFPWWLVGLFSVVSGLRALYKSYLCNLLTVRADLAKHFFFALLLGITIEFSLDLARPSIGPIARLETTAADWVMNFWVLSQEPSGEKNLTPFAWIQIDQPTYKKWQEPLTIPRDKLWELIARAIEAPAQLVIVDIQLDRSLHQEGDKHLEECLELYKSIYLKSKDVLPHRNRHGTTSCFQDMPALAARQSVPPIIFPVSLRNDSSEHSLQTIRRSDFLHNVINGPPLFLASTEVETDQDFTLRRWKLFVMACDTENHEPKVIPSIPLLAWALLGLDSLTGLSGGDPLAKKLDGHFKPSSCNLPTNPSTQDPLPLKDKRSGRTIELSLSPSYIHQRMIYPIGDIGEKCTPRKGIRSRGDIPSIHFQGRSEPLIVCRAASEFVTQPVPIDDVAGKIVVIGVDYQESGDFHITPFGKIPGALWVINAIESLLEYGQLTNAEKDNWWPIILKGTLLVLTACLFAMLTSLWATLGAGLLLLFVLGFSSVIAFQYGMWLDFTLPLFGIMLHRLSAILGDEYQGFWKPHKDR